MTLAPSLLLLRLAGPLHAGDASIPSKGLQLSSGRTFPHPVPGMTDTTNTAEGKGRV